MYIYENKLKENFWNNYNNKNRAVKYQFECNLRDGNIDLVTIEIYQENYQINAFEFKLSDIKKAISQAKENANLVNRSWIVVPVERKKVITDKYFNVCRQNGIGIIYVEESGRWEAGLLPKFNKNIVLTQKLLNFLMQGYC